jgi:hypothetical protein
MIATRLYDTYYDEWLYIQTTSGGHVADSAVNVGIDCPTS